MAKAKEKEVIDAIEVKGFVNPFNKGVSYADFLKAVNGKSIDEYCKGKLENEKIEWLKNEIKILKK